MAALGFARYVIFVLLLSFVASALATPHGRHRRHPARSHSARVSPLKASDSSPIAGPSVTNFTAPPSTSGNSLKWSDVIAFLTACLAAMVSIYAFVVYPHRVKNLEMRLKFIEEQLKELYGPLLAECIASDSMFRRVELALHHLKADHHHYNLRELRTADFAKQDKPVTDIAERHRRLFALFISTVYLPLNQKRTNLLKHNLHLIGPYPPVSLNLLLTHSAQFESLITVKREIDIDLSSIEKLDRYEDPYILTPYPMMLTAEVVAKVALLKALQHEHRYRLSLSKFYVPDGAILKKQYFLVLPESLRDELSKCTDTRSEAEKSAIPIRRKEQRAFNPSTCPLLWGPYLAIELFELRSWLINRYRPVAALKPSLPAETIFIEKMLDSQIVYSDRDGIDYPLHYRVAQLFDELDVPGSKMTHDWTDRFYWDDLENDENAKTYRLYKMKLLGKHTLKDLPKAPGFAYKEGRYKAMRYMDQNA